MDGFDVFTPIAEVATLKQRLLDAGCMAISNQSYNILRIEAGLPEFGVDHR